MSLDLSLPDPPEKKSGGALPVLMWLSVLALIALLVIRLPMVLTGGGADDDGPFGPDLADTLEARTLYGEAAAICGPVELLPCGVRLSAKSPAGSSKRSGPAPSKS